MSKDVVENLPIDRLNDISHIVDVLDQYLLSKAHTAEDIQENENIKVEIGLTIGQVYDILNVFQFISCNKKWILDNYSIVKQFEYEIMPLEEIREIYTGMEGCKPETCYEGYLLQEMKRMYDVAIEGIKRRRKCQIE